MTRPLHWLLIGLGAAAMGGPIVATGQSPVAQDEPFRIIAAFHAALKSSDGARALSLMTPDVLVYESGGVDRDRAAYESAHMIHDMPNPATESKTESKVVDQHVLIRGDVALVTVHRETRIESVGWLFDSVRVKRVLGTYLLVMTGEGWRIRHIHWSAQQPS